MDQGILLVAGLGNPGARYCATRHNVGFWFVDALAERYGGRFKAAPRFFSELCELEVASQACRLLKPDTFMNRSGQALAAVAGFYKIPLDRILVVHDELDLPPGRARLKQGGGHGGHNGLRNILELLGSEFLRLRLGIGHPGHKDAVIDYVLAPPAPEAAAAIQTAIAGALEIMPELMIGARQRAMHRLHSDAEQSGQPAVGSKSSRSEGELF